MLTFETNCVGLGLLGGVSDLVQVCVGGVNPDSLYVGGGAGQ